MNKGAAALAVTAVAAAGIIIYYASKKAASAGQTPTTLTLSASSNNTDTQTPVNFYADLTDQSGNAISSYPVILDMNGNPIGTTTTNSSGDGTWNLSLPVPGTYQFYAQAT